MEARAARKAHNDSTAGPARPDAPTRAPGMRKTAGDAAETLAAEHLTRHGLQVLARQFRCRGGELDLVCRQGRTLVFVEVRLRRSAAFGGAGASITAAKQARVIHAARVFLAARPRLAGLDCRFDCVLLDALDPARVEWLRDAFRCG